MVRDTHDFRMEDIQYADEISNAKVRDFFVYGTKKWDEYKVRQSFNNCDLNAILATRIPQNSTRDMLAWFHVSDGQYSVKTGYKFCHSQHFGDDGVHQSSGWGKVWKLPIPHKLKVFLWSFVEITFLLEIY